MAKTSNPFTDMMEQFGSSMKGLPIDFDSMMKTGQANVDALNEINKLVVESFQTMTKKQQEIAAESFSDFQDMAKDLGKMDASAASLSKSTDAYRKMFDKLSSNVEEMAELANKSQSEIWTILSNRWKDNMSAVQTAPKAAPKKAAS